MKFANWGRSASKINHILSAIGADEDETQRLMMDVSPVPILHIEDVKIDVERVLHESPEMFGKVSKAPSFKITIRVINKEGSKAYSNTYSATIPEKGISSQRVRDAFKSIQIKDVPIVPEDAPRLKNQFWGIVLSPLNLTKIFSLIERIQRKEYQEEGKSDYFNYNFEVSKQDSSVPGVEKEVVLHYDMEGHLAPFKGKPFLLFEKNADVIITEIPKTIGELANMLGSMPCKTKQGHPMSYGGFWFNFFNSHQHEFMKLQRLITRNLKLYPSKETIDDAVKKLLTPKKVEGPFDRMDVINLWKRKQLKNEDTR